ncbi:MAG: hypothetical protein V2A53_04140 [bacterium]
MAKVLRKNEEKKEEDGRKKTALTNVSNKDIEKRGWVNFLTGYSKS